MLHFKDLFALVFRNVRQTVIQKRNMFQDFELVWLHYSDKHFTFQKHELSKGWVS